MRQYFPVINTEANIPEDVFDALFMLKVRRSMTGRKNISHKEVIDFLSSKIDGFSPESFDPSFLLKASNF
jgi:hypothetical protein